MYEGADGEIVITTRMDNSKISKQLQALKDKLESQKIDLEITTIDYEYAKKQIEWLEKDLESAKQSEERINAELQKQIELRDQLKGEGKDTSVNNEVINELYDNLSNARDKVINITDEWLKQDDALTKIELKQKKQINNIEQTENKIADLVNETDRAGKNIDLSPLFNKMEKSLTKISKKVSRIGLSMLGIRSLYGMISSSASYIKNNNKELANSMARIQAVIDAIVGGVMTQMLPAIEELLPTIEEIANVIYSIVSTLLQYALPIIKKIVGWIGLLIKWIGRLLGDFIGIDMSSNQLEFNLRKSTKQAKELRKQLMGFDEMNILSENGTTGVLGNLGSSLGEIKNEKTAYQTELNEAYSDINELEKDLNEMGYVSVTTNKELNETREQLEKFINDAIYFNRIEEKNGIVHIFDEAGREIQFTRKEWLRLVDDIGHRRVTSRNISIWQKARNELQKLQARKELDLPERESTSGTGHTGGGRHDTAVTDYEKLLEKISKGENLKEFAVSVDKTGTYILKRGKEVYKITKTQFNHLEKMFENNKVVGEVQDIVKEASTGLEKTLNGTSNTTDIINDIIRNGIAYVKDQLKGATIVYENGMYKVQTVSGKTYTLTKEQYNEYKDTFLKGIPVMEKKATDSAKTIENQNKTSAKNSQDAWSNAFTNIGNSATNGAKAIADKINEILGDDNSDDIVNSTTNALQEASKTINNFKFPTKKVKVEPDTSNFLTKLKTAINNSASALALAVQLTIASTGGKKGAKGLLVNPPRLAVGGIINRPGRGVAIGGERGAEAVVPLTDSQQMALLGETIGKHVTVVATVPVYVGNRQIAREVRKINAEDEFGYNGGL